MVRVADTTFLAASRLLLVVRTFFVATLALAVDSHFVFARLRNGRRVSATAWLLAYLLLPR